MESQPQNPEFRNNPENFRPWVCLAEGPQSSDTGEARTRGPSVSSQALYHWATALPQGLNTFLYDISTL